MLIINQQHLPEIMDELLAKDSVSKEDLQRYFNRVVQELAPKAQDLLHQIDALSLEVHRDPFALLEDLLALDLPDQRSILEGLLAKGYLRHFQAKYCPQGPLVFQGRTLMAYDEQQTIKERIFVETSYSTTGLDQADLVEIYVERPREYQVGGKQAPALYIANPYLMGTNEEAFKADNLHGIEEEAQTPVKDMVLKDWSKKVGPRSDNPITESSPLQEVQEPAMSQMNPAMKRYLAKGYAVIHYAGRGAYYSQGFNLTGSVEELDAVDATLRWLDGQAAAYYDLQATQPVRADWFNGSVAMTGKSYLGTLAIGTATYSRSKCLKTILPEAGISSWYDYYRYNNLVVAPQGYPGEDIDSLSWYCESFLMNPTNSSPERRERFMELFDQMRHDMDRESGHYNAFWDERNYLNQADQIQIPMLIIHGTNDWNVKISHLFKLLNASSQSKSCRNFLIHRGKHICIHSMTNFPFLPLMDAWLDHYLLGLGQAPLKNGQGYVQSNLDPNDWQLVDYDQRQTVSYCLQEGALVKGEASDVTGKERHTFKTALDFSSAKDWQEQLLQTDSPLALRFDSPVFESPLHLHGDMVLTVKAKSDRPKGALSCMLVDLGKRQIVDERVYSVADKQLAIGLTSRLPQTSFSLEPQAQDVHVITRGWMNLETLEDTANDQGYACYQIDMIGMDYTLAKGHRLGLVIFGNDYLYTLRPKQSQTYEIYLPSLNLQLDLINEFE